MIQKYAILLFCFLGLLSFSRLSAQSPTGELRGKVTDGETGEPIPFANVIIKLNGAQKGGVSANFEGEYVIKPIYPGTYDVHASSLGYAEAVIKGYEIGGNKVSYQNIQLRTKGVTKDTVVITVYQKPLVEQDEGSGGRLNKTDIDKAPTRDVGALVNLTAGTNNGSFKGQRSSGTVYYIDGVRQFGAQAIPPSSVQEVNTITGGIPAEYGDLTGGVVSIITQGPTSKFAGGLQVITSELLDGYGYNVVEGSLSGPLILKNRLARGTDTAEARVGFMLSANLTSMKDPYPSPVGVWELTNSENNYLYNNPLSVAPSGNGLVPTAAFMTKADMQNVTANPNASYYQYNVNFKLDFNLSKNLNLKIGGQTNHQENTGYGYALSLFDYQGAATQQLLNNTYRGYASLTQKLNFKSNPDSKKGIKISNAYYTLNFNYTNTNSTSQDVNFKTNYFDYGYVGKFEVYAAPVYSYQIDTIKGKIQHAYTLAGYQDTAVNFTPSKINQGLANYTSDVYKLSNLRITNLPEIQQLNGLLNGDLPQLVNSIWYNTSFPGTGGSYSKSTSDQIALQGQVSADINHHAIKIGFEYQQQTFSSYSLNCASLWTRMRQLVNSHLVQLDTKNPIPVYDSTHTVFLDTVNYNLLNNGKQTTFDKNFRNYLKSIGAKDVYGNAITDNTLINTDRYSPSDFKLNMFSPDDLLQQQNVSYYGYDYLGNKLSSKPSLNDFLNNDQRLIAPYAPIYMAGFIQDQFVYKDIIFRLGVRLDRFDANEPVLKDKYSLYPIKTVGEVASEGNLKPISSMGSNYAVYVDDPFNPKNIVGYRNGDVWYDNTGNQIVDPTVLALKSTSGTIAPYLEQSNPNQLQLTTASFTNYQPQLNVAPRIYFAFPISENANFYADYDVRYQRPEAGNFATIDEYYYLEQRGTSILPNAALQPEKITNYEVGFKQKVGPNSAVSLNAYYNETRNLIDLRNIVDAYPRSYETFDNIDFSTTKGISLTYDLRKTRTSNFSMILSYTLQFADGTGSNYASQQSLIEAGEPNLRAVFPLDNDVRNNIQSQLDYRFRGGQAYNGPVTKNGTKILENTGINILFSALSGAPYSAQGNVTEAQGIGIRQSSVLFGTVNGSRMPWTFNINLKIDRDFYLTLKKKSKDKNMPSQPNMYLNVYVWISNLLNLQNVVAVYRYTGNPSDDGWLASSYGATAIQQATLSQAYYDQYSVKVNAPYNYSTPRLIRIGATLNF